MTRSLLLTAFAAAFCAATAARGETIAFDIALAGVPVATLELEGTADGDRYAVTGGVRTTRGAGLLRRVGYAASAQGRVRQGRLLPETYSGEMNTGRRRSVTRIVWQDGLPVAEVTGETRPAGDPPAPADLRGAVDPLTALFAGMRDVPAEAACDLDILVFDGRRLSRATLSAPQAEGETVVCGGLYLRLAGFTDEEMAEHRSFPFTATWAPAGDGRLRLVELRTATIFGKAVLRRR